MAKLHETNKGRTDMSYETETKFHLAAYSEEIHGGGVYDRITVEKLIASHRELRKISILYHERLEEEVRLAYDRAYSAAYTDCTANGFVALDDLREMTLSQLCELMEN